MKKSFWEKCQTILTTSGSDFDRTVNCHSVKEAERWVNDYPRKIFNGITAWERFAEELEKQGIVLKAV